MIGWRGNHIAYMNFTEYAMKYGSPFWDFHRASVHKCLLNCPVELSSKVLTKSSVSEVKFGEAGGGVCMVLLHNGRRLSADLVVGAHGINSAMQECLVEHPDKPPPTGDLAYRLLFKTKDMIKDAKLR